MMLAVRYVSRVCRFPVLAATTVVCAAVSAAGAELMPTAQQNALVGKYCAVCHTDAVRNGGLSLEHFDAAQAAPSLVAMLLSKISGGGSLETIRAAETDPVAAAVVSRKMRSGAMGAAGIPVPDKATIDGLIHAFTVESDRAFDWTVERSSGPASDAPELTASSLREVVSPMTPGDARMYRLTVSCKVTAKEGFAQLAWSPQPKSGTIAISADGKAAVRYPVEGREKMGNGSSVVTSGLAALVFSETRRETAGIGLPLPGETLTVGELFTGETVTFSFSNFPLEQRHAFEACFPRGKSSESVAGGF